MNVAQAIVASLESFGVKHVYGLIGTSILDLIDAMNSTRIRYISTRHEQVAVSMADAEGRVTGNAGVAFVHGGPGFLNSLISIADAYKDSVPLVVVAGAVKRRLAGMDLWLEVRQQEMVRPVVKGSFRLERGTDAFSLMSSAYSHAMSDPKGPVVLEVPEDVFHLEGGMKVVPPEIRRARGPSKEEVASVRGMLLKSRRPVILAGGGVNSSAGAEALLAFANRHGVPVMTTGNGRGVLAEDHELALGRVGFGGGNTVADAALESADLVLAVGAGLSDVTTYGFNLLPKGETVVVDLDPLSEQKPIPYSMHLNCDATAFLRELLRLNLEYKPEKEWLEFVAQKRRSWDTLTGEAVGRRYADFVNPSRFFKTLDGRMPSNVVVTGGQGLHILYAYSFLRIRSQGGFLAATNLGAMGYAFPAALGAKVAHPEREVIGVLGDGEFLMTVQDLETAVRERIGVKIVVVNDNSYRVLLMRQMIQKMGRVFGTTHTNPDTVKLAEAFGARGMRVKEDERIDEAVKFTLERDEIPRILELTTSPEDLPPLNIDASLKF